MSDHDIKLPPLPKGDIAADTCPVMWVHTDQQIESYAREAIKADRQRRGEPVAWLYEDELPNNYPYAAMFPYSKVDGVRMFPVYAPQPDDYRQALEAVKEQFDRFGDSFPDGFDSRVFRWVGDALAAPKFGGKE